MSIQAVGWALAQEIASSSAKFVLVAIANYADKDGRCWPSQKAVAFDTSLTDRSIRKAIAVLEDLGFIKRVERRRPDGSRASDVIQIVAFDTGKLQPEDFSGGMEESSAPTGKKFRAPRKSTTDQPEKFSGLTTFEPSKNHQRNHSSAASPPAAAETVDRFDEFWAVYPKRGLAANPRKPARDKFLRAVKSGADPEAIIGGARRYAEIEKRSGRFGTEKVAQAQTWLNQQRWADYPAVPPSVASSASRATIFSRG